MKKLSRILLAASMLAGSAVSMTACGNGGSLTAIAKEDIKIGLICLHDENSTYDLNFINGMNEAVSNLGLNASQLIIKRNIEEGSACYDTAAELVDSGCNIVFADSFGHESYMVEAAKEFPSVRFAHATGVKAHTEKLENYYNAFASIYEGRYLAGVAGGMKLKELLDSNKLDAKNYEGENIKIGYVGAWPYAEVKSGYTSWYLGVKSVVSNVVMDVTFTNSWYDPVEEKNGATNLIGRGCALISQHADSMGAPNACEEAGVPNVSYNGSTEKDCPNTFIVSSRINWAPYYEYLVKSAINNTKIEWDYTGTIETGSVTLTDLGSKAAAGTLEKINAVKADLQNKKVDIFDTAKFTVGGKQLSSYKANVDVLSDTDFDGETEVIRDGVFYESEKRSAPYFDINIDGITLLNGF